MKSYFFEKSIIYNKKMLNKKNIKTIFNVPSNSIFAFVGGFEDKNFEETDHHSDILPQDEFLHFIIYFSKATFTELLLYQRIFASLASEALGNLFNREDVFIFISGTNVSATTIKRSRNAHFIHYAFYLESDHVCLKDFEINAKELATKIMQMFTLEIKSLKIFQEKYK